MLDFFLLFIVVPGIVLVLIAFVIFELVVFLPLFGVLWLTGLNDEPAWFLGALVISAVGGQILRRLAEKPHDVRTTQARDR